MLLSKLSEEWGEFKYGEFGEMIPLYLRQPAEGKGVKVTSQEECRAYLDSVLETISEFT